MGQAGRETVSDKLKGRAVDQFIRDRVSPFWSAATCRRFGPGRLAAPVFRCLWARWSRQIATDQSGDRSPLQRVVANAKLDGHYEAEN
jgi:hypothetical protein